MLPGIHGARQGWQDRERATRFGRATSSGSLNQLVTALQGETCSSAPSALLPATGKQLEAANRVWFGTEREELKQFFQHVQKEINKNVTI